MMLAPVIAVPARRDAYSAPTAFGWERTTGSGSGDEAERPGLEAYRPGCQRTRRKAIVLSLAVADKVAHRRACRALFVAAGIFLAEAAVNSV